MRAMATGDEVALHELFTRHAPWLGVRLRRRCSDDDLVADVMQETYLAVWRAAGSFAGSATSGRAVGWLWTIAGHRLVDAFRRRARQNQVPAVPLASAGVVVSLPQPGPATRSATSAMYTAPIARRSTGRTR